MASGGRIERQAGGGIAALLQQLAAQHAQQYGQMPGGPGTEAQSRIKHTLQMPSAEAQRRLSPGSLPPKQQGGIQSGLNAGAQFANLYKSGKELKKDVTDFFKKEPEVPPEVKGASSTTVTKTTEPGAAPAGARTELQPGSQQADLQDIGEANTGLAPPQNDIASLASNYTPDEELDALSSFGGGGGDFFSAFAARGGRINRYAGGRAGYRAGGLPSGLAPEEGIDIPDDMPGYKLGEGMPKPGGGGGGGGGALSAVGTAVGVASAAAKILPFLIGLSDSRVKHHKEPIGELFDGQKVYRYDFGDGRTEIGLLAQQVEKRHPDAVSTMGGLKFVDYDKATSRVKKQGGGGLGDILDLDEERRADAEPMREEERGLNPKRLQLAALERAETMSDAAPMRLDAGTPPVEGGLGAGQGDLLGAARAAARGTFGREATGLNPVQMAAVAPDASATPRGRPESSETPAVVAQARPAPDAVPTRPPSRPAETDNLSPQALRAYTIERAKALGMDPDFAAKVFQGESGFRANAKGDDGSSFGVAQLHYGNTSERYPRPGLGDVFTRETGLDARDPNNARAVIDWSLKHASENGWNAWTVARNLKAGGDKSSSVDKALDVSSRYTKGPWEKIGEKTGIPEMMRDERVFVPLLAGIGSMLASDKPRFSQALGEGLAGAAGAYGAVRGQTQDIAEGVAREGLTKAQTSRSRILETGTGRAFLFYVDQNGQEQMMDLDEAYKRLDEGTLPPLDPATSEQLREKAKGRGTAQAPPTQLRPGVQGEGGTPEPAKPSSVVPPVVEGLSPEDMEAAQRWRQESRGKTPSWVSGYADIYTPQQKRAEGAREFQSQFTPMAAALASAPSTGTLAPGALQSALRPIVGYVNSLSSTLGVDAKIKEEDFAKREEALKYISRLRTAATERADMKAVSALDAIAAGYPSDTNTKRGIAKLLAGMQVETSREVDKNEYYQKFKEAAERGQRGALVANRSGSFANLEEKFAKDRAAVEAKEKEGLERMYLQPAIVTRNGQKMYYGQTGKLISADDVARGTDRPMTWSEIVIKKGADLTPSQKSFVQKEFGYNPEKGRSPSILRHFGQ
jgi:hypothetical protein